MRGRSSSSRKDSTVTTFLLNNQITVFVKTKSFRYSLKKDECLVFIYLNKEDAEKSELDICN
jgi:hypothetical protein